MNVMHRILRALPLTIALVAQGAYGQWNGATSGRIRAVEVTHINNFPFRVMLEGEPVLCTAGHRWAYVDGNGSNYKVFVATPLLAAKARGVPVYLYTLHDASGQSYCRIEHVWTE